MRDSIFVHVNGTEDGDTGADAEECRAFVYVIVSGSPYSFVSQ